MGLWETISFVDRPEFLLSGTYVMPVKTPLNASQFKAVSSEVKQAIGKNQCLGPNKPAITWARQTSRRKEETTIMYIFVLDINKQFLGPCHPV